MTIIHNHCMLSSRSSSDLDLISQGQIWWDHWIGHMWFTMEGFWNGVSTTIIYKVTAYFYRQGHHLTLIYFSKVKCDVAIGLAYVINYGTFLERNLYDHYLRSYGPFSTSRSSCGHWIAHMWFTKEGFWNGVSTTIIYNVTAYFHHQGQFVTLN